MVLRKRTQFYGHVRTPPKVGPSGTENLEGCRGRANKCANKGEGGEPRAGAEHFSRLEGGRGPWVRRVQTHSVGGVGISLMKKSRQLPLPKV